FDLNTAEKQRRTEGYEDLIKNGAPKGSRSDLFHSVVGHLCAQGLSEEEIFKKFKAHPNGIGAKFVGRLDKEVRRSYRKWQKQKQAQAGGALPPPPTGPGTQAGPGAQPGPKPRPRTWPSIRIIAGELPRVVDEAERALLASGYELYQRGGLVVRP